MRRLIAALLIAQPATAAVPPLVPVHDVTIAYDVAPQNHAPIEVRVSIAAGGEKLRILAENLPTSFLIDRSAHSATILLPMLKLFTTVPIGRYDLQATVLRHARFERHGRETLAGFACTDWTASSAEGTASACITEDGVILSGHAADRHGDIGSIRAASVQYGALPPSLFDLPHGYRNAGNLPIEGLVK